MLKYRSGRLADFLELGGLCAKDAQSCEESCGAHYREEHRAPEGKAMRDDENYTHVAAWEYKEKPRTWNLEITQRKCPNEI